MSNGASAVAGDDGLSYEQARAELAQIVAQLESGGQSLEESLALWTRGEELADRCQEWLTGAAARLEAALADSAEAAAAEAIATAGGTSKPATAESAEPDEA